MAPRDTASVTHQFSALSTQQRDLLTVLGLVGPRTITQLAGLVRAAGIREATTRVYSTTSLRKVLERLVERGLLTVGEVGFDCVPIARQLALRDAATRGVLDRLAAMIRLEAHRYLHYSSIGGHEAAWFDFRVALTRRDLHQASTFLVQCAEYDVERFLTQNPLVESVCAPFDPEWLAGFGAHRGALIAWTLDYANRTALPCYGLMSWLVEHAASLTKDVPGLRVLLMEAAVLRGDEFVASIPPASELGHTTAALAFEATQALVRGQYESALDGFERASAAIQGLTSKRSEVSLPRVFMLFHGLALLHRGQAADLARVSRLATSRNRDKNYEFRDSALALKRLSESAAAPSTPGHSNPPQVSSRGTDCLSLLLRGLHAVWFDTFPEERAWLLDDVLEAHRDLAHAEYPWLAAEYGQLARQLDQSLTAGTGRPKRTHASTIDALTTNADSSRVRPLWTLYEPKPGWLLALQALEQIVSVPSSPAADDAAQERVSWRVDPASGQIEPILQKRTGSGWTRGRKIAPKQLLEDGPQHPLLTAADREVTMHIAEEVESNWGGYVNRTHFFKPTALLALVGHPLVFVLPDLDVPAELARGEVRLRAETVGDKLIMRVEPPGVSEQPQIVREGQRWIVYALDKQQAAVAKVVGQQLSIPQNGRVQSLDVLGRLAQFFVVHSSEQVEARMVEADSTPWLRMVPSGTGLTVTAAVRPLGEHGPMLSIGHGVPTLVANIQGTPLQTERALEEETSRFEAMLGACPVLALAEVEPFNYALPEPEACLELVSQLRDLGDSAHVEWPFGKRFGVRARLGAKSLRGSIRHDGGWFLASGTLQVDSELNLDLQELMTLLAEGSDRFVKLETGEYLELEQELRDMVGALRHAEQRGGKKQLAVPMAALATLEQLTSERLGLKLDPACSEWRQRFDAAFSRPIAIPKGLTAELRDYQAEGFRWLARLAELELGACLADDMGLGKTVEIIALFLHRASHGAALVVAPTSVCDNWRQEIERFAPSLLVRDYSGPARAGALESLGKRHIVVTSYTLLQQDSDSLQALDWSIVVLDEGQFIKNADTLRAKAAYGLRAKARIIATGTPIENHPNDLFSLFRFLNPHLLGSMQAFQRRFGRATESGDEIAAHQRKELRRVIRPFILRRTKAQVLDDLPPLTEIRHTVNLSAAEAQLYEGLRKRAVAKLENSAKSPQARVQILAELMRLRRLCCHPALVAPEARLESAKLASFVELVEELLASQHRALVFSQFVDFLELAKTQLDTRGIRYQYLDGSTPQKQRSARVEAFQNGEGELFLISLKAGGFGLNLTGADYVIHLDPWWNPAVEQQASDRAHRIGQTRPVTVYRLVTAGTIEERIVELHHRKREVANSLLEGTEGASNISQDELLELLAE